MNKHIMSKAVVLSIIFLFIGIGFTSVTAIKYDASETKVNPVVSSFDVDVYYDCEIETPGPIWGMALLFPGYFRSLKPDVIPTNEADGILLCGIFNDEHDDLTIDNNTYFQNDWIIIIVSNFTGLMDNWGDLQNRFFISGFASRVVVYDLNPFN